MLGSLVHLRTFLDLSRRPPPAASIRLIMSWACDIPSTASYTLDEDGYSNVPRGLAEVQHSPGLSSAPVSRSVFGATQKQAIISVAQYSEAIPAARLPSGSYRPSKLRWPWLTALVCIEAGVFVTLVVLDMLSAKNNGLTSVSEASGHQLSEFAFTSSWATSLLWTDIPTFLMKLFEQMWATVVAATAERQPYVDLCRPVESARSARQTIVLDYARYPLLYSWCKAWKNGHRLVAVSLFVCFVTSLALVPLASHLFATAPSIATADARISVTGAFDQSALSNGSTSLRPALDLANAIRAYGSAPPSWMTPEYAFLPFQTVDGGTAGNISWANATAYSARLDCQHMEEYNASVSSTDDEDVSTLKVSGFDRGCPISTFLTIGSRNGSIYGKSWVTTTCPNSEHARIGILSGYYSNSSSTKLAGSSLISCIAHYYQSTGILTVAASTPAPASLQFVSFNVSAEEEMGPGHAQTLIEITLSEYETLDISANVQADAFGLAVLETARARNSSSPFDSATMLNATADVYATVFAGITHLALIGPLSSSSAASLPRQQATVSTSVVRLYVTRPIAWTLEVLAFSMLLCTASLFVYAQCRESILREEPVGLLGRAVVLDGSNIADVVQDAKVQKPEDEKVRKFIMKRYPADQMKVWFDGGIQVDCGSPESFHYH